MTQGGRGVRKPLQHERTEDRCPRRRISDPWGGPTSVGAASGVSLFLLSLRREAGKDLTAEDLVWPPPSSAGSPAAGKSLFSSQS